MRPTLLDGDQRAAQVSNQLRQIHRPVGVFAEQPKQSVSLDKQGCNSRRCFIIRRS
jgi:hypothetical protein